MGRRTPFRSHFYPRPPRGGRRQNLRPHSTHCQISIHALREEGDVFKTTNVKNYDDFYPRPPRGGRLLLEYLYTSHLVFLSTPSARRATSSEMYGSAAVTISIHALREEGDRSERPYRFPGRYFYPRPPRGGRHHAAAAIHLGIEFLSTPSARRATIRIGERTGQQQISIHALREEGDLVAEGCQLAALNRFLSTPSARRATRTGVSDAPVTRNFYPRPPRGGRHTASLPSYSCWSFLSTPSARRATLLYVPTSYFKSISIHALREEGDHPSRSRRR